MSGAPPGDKVYRELLDAEVADQTTRKASFEQRSMTVITSSGTLVTLLFGLAALSTSGDDLQLTDATRVWLGLALAAFLIAALLALAVNLPYKYEPVDEDDVHARLKDDQGRDELAAHRDIALTQIKVLKAAKSANGKKGNLLLGAILCEAIAVTLVGGAVLQLI